MVKKSKLLSALEAHQGRDFAKERQKKLQKAAEKRKNLKQLGSDDGEARNGIFGADENMQSTTIVEMSKANRKTSSTAKKETTDKTKEAAESENDDHENDIEDVDSDENAEGQQYDDQQQQQQEEEEEEEDIPLSDLSAEDAADIVPHQRLTINNSSAILSSLKRISFIDSQTPFSEHNSLLSSEPINVPDPNDDLNRELEFYKVCVSAARTARSLFKKEGITFSRPKDYFAEMVKSDEHMGKIKKKLYDAAAAKKASTEAKKQRELKKFGKQVQVAKLQQRQKEKRDTLEKINSLKRKRRADKAGPTEEEDPFDVAIEEASKAETRRGVSTRRGPKGTDGPSAKRQKRNEKYGFGGKKRFSKSGDAISSGDMSSFSVGKMKSKSKGTGKPHATKRLGKNRRATTARSR